MANLNIDGCAVDISFNISGKDHLKQKLMYCMQNGISFELKTDFNGESYFINPELLVSMHMPSRMVTRHANMEQLQYQIGIAFMFCTDIIPMPDIPKTLTLKEQELLSHGIQ